MADPVQLSVETPTSGTMRYAKAGAGRGLVLLHRSIGADSARQAVRALASEFMVLAPAMPGYDDSERPDWARSPRDLAAILLHSLVPSAGDRPVLVGCGLGGFIAAEMAAMCPERLGALVLVSPMGVKPHVGGLTDQFLWSTDEYVEMCFASAENHQRAFGDVYELGSDPWKQREANREMTTRIAWKPRLFDNTLPFRLPYVTTPTLIVWGEEDRILPRSSVERYRDSIPGATLAELPGCGHMVECDALDALCKHISSFVQGNRS
jgi:pimeloyl-ACP methyl ester carboxylesterase